MRAILINFRPPPITSRCVVVTNPARTKAANIVRVKPWASMNDSVRPRALLASNSSARRALGLRRRFPGGFCHPVSIGKMSRRSPDASMCAPNEIVLRDRQKVRSNASRNGSFRAATAGQLGRQLGKQAGLGAMAGLPGNQARPGGPTDNIVPVPDRRSLRRRRDGRGIDLRSRALRPPSHITDLDVQFYRGAWLANAG
jgi:hypothetical protein